MKLILGLGNPGKKYDNTRHNIGFSMLDFMVEKWLKAEGFANWQENKKLQAEISDGKVNGEKIILAKPLTFMNNSGIATQAILTYYKMTAEDLIVIQDEIDLTLGNFKIQKDRSSAGHRGIQSIIDQLGTQDFTRIRIGIGKENREKQGETSDFVLKKFTLMERLQLKAIKEKIMEEMRKMMVR